MAGHRFRGVRLESLHVALDVRLLRGQLLDLRLGAGELLLEYRDARVGGSFRRGDHLRLDGFHVRSHRGDGGGDGGGVIRRGDAGGAGRGGRGGPAPGVRAVGPLRHSAEPTPAEAVPADVRRIARATFFLDLLLLELLDRGRGRE